MQKIDIEVLKIMGDAWKSYKDATTELICHTSLFIPKSSKVYKDMIKLDKLVAQIKSDLEDEMFDRVPGMTTDIFYGKRNLN